MPPASGSVSRTILIFAGLVIIVAGLRAGAELLVPFLLAAFIAVLCAPPMFWLQRKGWPPLAALSLIIVVIIGANVLLTVLVGTSINDFSANVPQYQQRLQQEAAGTINWLQQHGVRLPAKALLRQVNPGSAMKLVGTLLAGFGGMLTNAFLILLTVVFILLEAAGFPAKMRQAFGNDEVSGAYFHSFSNSLNHYLKIKTWVSLGTGAAAGLFCWALGVDYPLLWGLLAFLFNYVPNIGSIMAAVPPVLLGYVQFGGLRALLLAGGYLVINTVCGNVIEPRYLGRGLGLSSLVVFASLVVWGWVLGPVGMLLSVPLTMTAKLALEAGEETRWLAVLLGPAGEVGRGQ